MSGAATIRTLVGIVVLLVISYIALKIVPVTVRTFRFNEAIRHEVIYGSPAEPASRIHSRVAAAAVRLGLPVREQDIRVEKNRQQVTIDADYTVPIEFLGLLTWEWHLSPHHEGRRTSPVFGEGQ